MQLRPTPPSARPALVPPICVAAFGKSPVWRITDGDPLGYRGNPFYDLAKASAIRLALGMAEELRPHGVAALAVTPGFPRSEAVLDHFGVTEANWRDGAARDPHLLASEAPVYIGREIAALAANDDVLRKSGGVHGSWT